MFAPAGAERTGASDPPRGRAPGTATGGGLRATLLPAPPPATPADAVRTNDSPGPDPQAGRGLSGPGTGTAIHAAFTP
jgi:hypothetical protein